MGDGESTKVARLGRANLAWLGNPDTTMCDWMCATTTSHDDRLRLLPGSPTQ